MGFRESQSVPAFEGLRCFLGDRFKSWVVQSVWELVCRSDPPNNSSASRTRGFQLEKTVFGDPFWQTLLRDAGFLETQLLLEGSKLQTSSQTPSTISLSLGSLKKGVSLEAWLTRSSGISRTLENFAGNFREFQHGSLFWCRTDSDSLTSFLQMCVDMSSRIFPSFGLVPVDKVPGPRESNEIPHV